MQVRNPLPSLERLQELFEYKDGALFYKKDLCNSLGKKTKIVAGTRAGGLHPLGYRKLRVDGKMYFEHRIIWQLFNNELNNFVIDHINNKRDDNRIENLRLASCNENNQNSVIRKDNTSGVKGITWNERDKRWTVSISFNGKRKSLGNFKDFSLAKEFIELARDMIHGKFANHGLTA